MTELKKFRDRVKSMKLLIEQSNMRPEWKQIARDAALAWVAARTEEEWMEDAGVTPIEAEYLRREGVWPWRKES